DRRRRTCTGEEVVRIATEVAWSREPVWGFRHVGDTKPWTERRRGFRRKEVELGGNRALAPPAKRYRSGTDGRRLSLPGADQSNDLERSDAAVRGCHDRRVEPELTVDTDELQCRGDVRDRGSGQHRHRIDVHRIARQ